MNKKITANEFRETLDCHASNLKANPWLAQSIIASEMKGGTKVKRKWTTSLAIALLIILTLGTVAYGVSSMFRVVDWDGEVTNKELPEPVITREDDNPLYGKLMRYREKVPDTQMARAWFDSEDENGMNSTDKPVEKHFNCAEDFLEYMSGFTSLTVPARFPEGEYVSFDATVTLLCRDTGKFELQESGDEGPIHYFRYSMNEADAVPCQYFVVIKMKDGTEYRMQSLLWFKEEKDATGLNEGETFEKVTARGMDGALVIRNHKNAGDRDVVMMRKLDEPICCKTLLSIEPYEESSAYFYDEHIWMWGPEGTDPIDLVKMFNGE